MNPEELGRLAAMGMVALMLAVLVIALYQCLFATAVNAEKESSHEHSLPQVQIESILDSDRR